MQKLIKYKKMSSLTQLFTEKANWMRIADESTNEDGLLLKSDVNLVSVRQGCLLQHQGFEMHS